MSRKNKKHKRDAFNIRFLGGPHDGASRHINPSSPPTDLSPLFDNSDQSMWIRWFEKGKRRIAVYRATEEDWDDESNMKIHFVGYEQKAEAL